MRYLFYTAVPFLVLLVATSLSCTVGYFIVLGIGDAIPFRQILTRSTQLFLVLSIFPVMTYLKINKEALGFAPKWLFFKQLLQGFGLGFITLLPVFITLSVLEINVVDETQILTVGLLAKTMTINLLIALLISMIEEPLFRGLLLVSLHKKMSVIAAILISSTYYAGLHFLSIKTDLPVQEINLSSSFRLLGEAFGNVINPGNLPAFCALLMVGIFLGVLRTQVKVSLGLCIGCHTCWVWQIKMSKKLFNTDLSSEYIYLVSNYDGIIGLLVAGWLMLVIAAYFIYQQIKQPKNVSGLSG
jgi:membrane protease YdiL (CAAX protease family)